MNYSVHLQKYAEDYDEKGKNNSGEQDQNLTLSWETGRKVQKSYPNKPITHTEEVTSEAKTHVGDSMARGQCCTKRIRTSYEQQIQCVYDNIILLQKEASHSGYIPAGTLHTVSRSAISILY